MGVLGVVAHEVAALGLFFFFLDFSLDFILPLDDSASVPIVVVLISFGNHTWYGGGCSGLFSS